MKRRKMIVFASMLFFLLGSLSLIYAGGAQEKEEEPVTIRQAVFVSPALVEYNKKMAAEFIKLHPNITVNIELVGFEDYLMKMQVDLATGTAPDIIYINPSINFPLVAYKGFVLPLDDYVNKDNFDLSDWYPEAVEWASFKGNLYAIAQEFGAGEPALYYNTGLFDEAGLSYPTEDWTYNDLLEAAKKLAKDTDDDGKIDQYGIIPPYHRRHLSNNTLVRSFGGGWVSDNGKTSLANRPETIEAVQFMADLVNVYNAAPLQPEGSQEATFGTGKIGMINGGLFSQIFLKGSTIENESKLGWTLMPKGKDGFISGGAGFGGNGITTSSKNPDAAWEWIEFLSTKENLRGYMDLGYQPSRKSLADELEKSDPGMAVFIEAVKDAKPSGTSCANLRDSEVLELLTQALGDVWAGRKSAEEALNSVHPKIQEVLDMPAP
jgi:multiple sugar transport system substrate-binding protein